MDNNISVIIPFYNSIDTLSIMLDSILGGSILPSEIILVDDGSTDNSKELANKYATKYPFIRVFSQNHQGVSAARNLGLSKATGTWISFVDSDDYIEPDMFSLMLQAIDSSASPVDGCICGYYTHKDGIITPYVYSDKSMLSSSDILESMFLDDSIRGFLFIRLFKRDLIKDLNFDTNVYTCEDLLFQTQLFSSKELVFAVVSSPLYHYVQQKGSATNSLSLFAENNFVYKSVYEQIYQALHKDYVLESYHKILEYNMYSLLRHYNENGDSSTRKQIVLLKKELKSTKRISRKSRRRIAFELVPFIYRHFMK